MHESRSDKRQKLLLCRKAFARVTEEFGFFGDINEVRGGHDKLIDEIYEEDHEVCKRRMLHGIKFIL